MNSLQVGDPWVNIAPELKKKDTVEQKGEHQ
jgi:hypothetical protein